jgi:hypothetical protein
MERRISATQYREMTSKKQLKMRNIKTVVDGIIFDSRKEADHYCELKILKRQGKIIDFFMQVTFLIHEGYYKDGEWVKPIYYKPDFVVIQEEKYIALTSDYYNRYYPHIKREIHEVKGRWTRTAIDKRKMFEKRYPEYEFIVI